MVDGMHTGFDMLAHNTAVRRHWLRRIVAGLVDIAIIFIPLYLILLFLNIPYKTIITGAGAGVAWFLYAAILEGKYGRTLGKQLVHLKVVSLKERRTFKQTFIRSIPKFLWYLFLPFDVMVGLAMEGDPRKRWIDGVARTLVIAYYPPVPKQKSRAPAPAPRMHKRNQEINASDE